MSQTDVYIEKLQQRVDDILDVVSGLSKEVIHWKPAEDVWSIMEILCHVEEANKFWLSELNQTVQSPERKWGRGHEHEGRLNGVARADELSVDEIIQKVGDTKKTIQETLSPLEDSDLDRKATHVKPKFGEKPLSFLLDHFMDEHLKGHKGQIERNLRQYKEQA